ncbi:MAG: hypothetical protein CM15mV88_260 [Caudoviricetes sp.]|nr:MAG: hypothetical protein CM15mV88_260 [Caudoviricetes sp.]
MLLFAMKHKIKFWYSALKMNPLFDKEIDRVQIPETYKQTFKEELDKHTEFVYEHFKFIDWNKIMII